MHLMDGHWFHSPVRFDSPATGRSWSSSSRNPAIPQGERLLNRGFSAIRARASKAALVTGFLGAFSLRAQSRRLRAVRVRAGPSSTEYDVIVIGAGLGGLACAAALGKAGRKVLVLEAHSVCGGCAHSFTRKAPGGGEYVFDSGPSILTDMGKRNPLRLVLDYVEASEYLEWIHYDGWGMLTPEGPWRLEVGKDSFRDKVGRQIPGLVLRDDQWQLLPLLLKFPGGLLPAIRDAPALSEPFSVVLDELEAKGKMQKGSWLRDWLDALAFSLSGLDCTGTTCAAMAFTMEELHWEGSRGLAYPKGGMGSVVEALVKAVEKFGGEVCTKVKVEEVLLEGQCAVGVRSSKGELRAREAVVCNAPIWDAAKLLPQDLSLDDMKQDWQEIKRMMRGLCRLCQETPMTRSYLHLHLGLDAEGLDLSQLEAHYTSMTNWKRRFRFRIFVKCLPIRLGPMSQAVVVRNTFLEVGGDEATVLDNFRRQVSEPVKMYSSPQASGEDSDEDFPKVSGLRAAEAVPLRTSNSTFPLWTLHEPLLLEEDECMPLWLEYKYVIRGKSEFRWEEAAPTSFMPEWSEVGKPLNRLLPFCRGRRLKPGLMLRPVELRTVLAAGLRKQRPPGAP
eukprot:g11858.t1